MKNLVLISIVLSFLFASCEKDAIEPSLSNNLLDEAVILIPSTAKLITEKSVITYPEGEVLDAANYAQLLANAIADKSVRNFIKVESNKKFDGDYNFLVNRVMESRVGSSTFKEKISQLNGSDNLKSANIFESALQNEKLNVSVPVLIDEWDVNKHELLVAVAVGAIEDETEYLYAYDSKGRAYLLDANIEPDVPVVVIANNERIGLDLTSSTDFKSARVSGEYEHLGYIKCYNLSKIESWYMGGPEFRIDCVMYDGSAAMNACGSTLIPSRSSAKTGYDPNINLFKWYFASGHGPNYYFQAWEIDNSGRTYKLPLKVSVPGIGEVGVEVSYTAQDKKLKGEIINYQTGVPHEIYDDIMRFKFEQE